MKQKNLKAYELDTSPAVHEFWRIKSEMQIINESVRIFSIQLREDCPTVRLGLTSFNRMEVFEIWALQMSHHWGKKIFAVEERNMVLWLLFMGSSPALDKFYWD